MLHQDKTLFSCTKYWTKIQKNRNFTPSYLWQNVVSLRKVHLVEVIQGILYKLKTGCQWHMIPVSFVYAGTVLHYKTVYVHFRKWPKNGEWEKVWSEFWSVTGVAWICLAGIWTAVTPQPFVLGKCSGYQSNIECCISRLAVNSEFRTLYLCCKANNRLLLS